MLYAVSSFGHSPDTAVLPFVTLARCLVQLRCARNGKSPPKQGIVRRVFDGSLNQQTKLQRPRSNPGCGPGDEDAANWWRFQSL